MDVQIPNLGLYGINGSAPNKFCYPIRQHTNTTKEKETIANGFENFIDRMTYKWDLLTKYQMITK